MGAGRGRMGRAWPGQALVWVVLMMPLFLSVIGLAIDGGQVFVARRELQNAVDTAARAGAAEIDIARLRRSDGVEVRLDAGLARAAAANSIAGHGVEGVSIGVSPVAIRVSGSRRVPLSFLRIVGLDTATIEATAVAEPFYGITTGQRP